MVRPALPLALATLVLLAGCSGGVPWSDTTTPAGFEPEIVGTSSTGGQCVEHPSNGFDVESAPNDDGTRIVTIAANVTVPGAHYVIDDIRLSPLDSWTYRFDVNTTTDPEKSERTCENGGIVHYEASIRILDSGSTEFQIWHDGRHVSGFGSGAET